MLYCMALPSKLCAALHGQSNVASMCEEVWTCQFFYQELTVTMVQVPEGMSVSTQGQNYIKYEEGHADQRRSFKLSSG